VESTDGSGVTGARRLELNEGVGEDVPDVILGATAEDEREP
jgi:hypothetical protein